ncbi:hypothetical protein LLEC1_02079 [Akanthomyces lecanii]|uniref:Uncharacterized protein n=1 Tax=Cordyceps confragosa TaxID=2714763 RepID=A0A179I9I9_CORDF|nr:hypothetical protein LLEC1_02079 [Akanthomyces lecanii]
MHAQLFPAFLALGALAAPQQASEPPLPSLEADVVTVDGVEVESAVLSTVMVDMLLVGNLTTKDNQLLGNDSQPVGDAFQ